MVNVDHAYSIHARCSQQKGEVFLATKTGRLVVLFPQIAIAIGVLTSNRG